MQGEGKIADDTVAWSLELGSRSEDAVVSPSTGMNLDVKDGGVENERFPHQLRLLV